MYAGDMVDRCYQLKLVAGQTVFIPTGTGNLLFYLYQRKKFDQEIVCEPGSGWIGDFFLDPELFVSYPDPGKYDKTDQ